MPNRLATLVALLAFVVCLIAGTFQAGNPFATTVARALAGMAGTYVVGLVIGVMGKRAIDENLTVKPAVPALKPPTATGR